MYFRPLPPRPRPPRWIPSAAPTAGNHFGAADLALTFTFDSNGVRTTFGVTAVPLSFNVVTAGQHTGIGSTIGRNLNFDFFTNGARTTFGASAVPLSFNISTSGARAAFGAADLGLTLGVVTEGTLVKRGSATLPLTFTFDSPTGKVTAFSTVDLPLTFTFNTTGTGGEEEAGSVRPRVDKEDLKLEPWPELPNLKRPRFKQFKPGYMRKRDA